MIKKQYIYCYYVLSDKFLVGSAVKCPNCNKEMMSGFVRATGNGGICWINEKVNYGAPRNADGYFQLGGAPYLKGESIPACNCNDCKVILIDYSNLR